VRVDSSEGRSSTSDSGLLDIVFGSTTSSGPFDPTVNVNYQKCHKIGEEIAEALFSARQQIRDEAAAVAAPKRAVTCPWCGATTTPDANGRCEYCGGAI
jgi:hypothetical protein